MSSLFTLTPPQCQGRQCGHVASGVWEIVPFHGTPRLMVLCAECGFHTVPNLRKASTQEEEHLGADGKVLKRTVELIWYKINKHVKLVSSIVSTKRDTTAVGVKPSLTAGDTLPLHIQALHYMNTLRNDRKCITPPRPVDWSYRE